MTAGASGAVAVSGASALAATLQTQPAAASVAGASGAVGTAGTASGAVVGSAAAATAGTVATTTGLAALVASLPVTVIGLAAAGVIVAGAVGVGGVLGLFSPDDDTPVTAGEPNPDDVVPTTEPSDQPSDAPAATDPTNIPEPTSEPTTEPIVDPTTEPTTEPTSEPTTEPTTEPTAEPTTPPDDPPVIPPGPANLTVSPPDLTGVTFVDGNLAALRLPVENTGGSPTAVQTDLIFPAGTAVQVDALPEMPAVAGFAVGSVAPADWTCAPAIDAAEGVVVSCTLAELPAGATSELIAGVRITDPTVDESRDLPIATRTWAPALGAAPAPVPTTIRLASPATSIVVGPVTDAALNGVLGSTASTTVTIPVTNTGTHAPATVDVTGIPAGVAVTPNDGWTCDTALSCTIADLPRGATRNLLLTLRDTTALVDVDRSGADSYRVTATGPTNAPSFALAVRSAPARYAMTFDSLTDVPAATIDTLATVQNTGRTTGTAIQARVDLPAGMTYTGAGWAPCTPGDPGAICRTVGTLAPGASTTLDLRLVAPTGKVPNGTYSVPVTATDAAGVTATTAADIQVLHGPAVLAVTAPSGLDLVRHQVATLTYAVSNTGSSAATGVTLAITLPGGMSFDGAATGSPWTCTAPRGTNRTATCSLPELAPGAASELTVRVHAEGAAAGPIATTVKADGVAAQTLAPIPVRVTVPTLSLSVDAETAFVQGVPRQVTAQVGNPGSSSVSGLTLTVRLPAETFWEGVPSGSPWTCSSTGGAAATVTCTSASLAAGGERDFVGTLRANGTASGRIIELTVAADGADPITEQTQVVIGAVCAPAWVQYTYYAKGDVVSYQGWNYERLTSTTSVYLPSEYAAGWRPLVQCR